MTPSAWRRVDGWSHETRPSEWVRAGGQPWEGEEMGGRGRRQGARPIKRRRARGQGTGGFKERVSPSNVNG